MSFWPGGYEVWPKNTTGTLSVISAPGTFGSYHAIIDIHYQLTLKNSRSTFGLFNITKHVADRSQMTRNVDSTPETGY